MKPKLLVVDDSPSSLALMTGLLEAQFEVFGASDGDEALNVVKSHPDLSVLFCDLFLGERNGLELITQIKQRIPTLGVTLITGQASLENAQAAINQGTVHRYLEKGVGPEELQRTAIECFHIDRNQRQEAELLEQTLAGFVAVIFDTLTAQIPALKPKTELLKQLVNGLVDDLHPERPWQVRLAGSLLWIGFLKVPHDVVQKVVAGEELTDQEWESFKTHPSHASEMLQHIPRLEVIGELINRALTGDQGSDSEKQHDDLACRILRIANDATWLLHRLGLESAVKLLQAQTEDDPDPMEMRVIQAAMRILEKNADRAAGRLERMEKSIGLLLPGDTLTEDLKTEAGNLLLSKGQVLSVQAITRLRTLARRKEIHNTITIARES